MSAAAERRLAAIMFTNIVDYTGLKAKSHARRTHARGTSGESPRSATYGL